MPTLRSLAVLSLLSCLACNGDAPRNGLPRPVGIDRSPALAAFASCADLEQTIEDAEALRMKSLLERNRVGLHGVPMGGGEVAVPAAAAADAAAGPTEYTTTNDQVEGVGEADLVQNDGTRIAVVAGGSLHLARSWPPEALARTASIAIEGWPHDLFLAGDTATVFSDVYEARDVDVCAAVVPPGGGYGCGYSHVGVKITSVDVSDPTAPEVTAELYLPGRYVSARRIGDRVRLVTSDSLTLPPDVVLWASLAPGATAAERDAAYAELAVRNEARIRARSLDDWLRRGTLKRPGAADVALGYDCTEFSRGSAPVLPGLLTVSTLDVGAGTVVSRTSVFGESGVVYASARTLYVGSGHWWWWPEPGQRDATYLHAFDLADPDRAAYLGSGVVDGSVRDQYAFDEHEGALRVVTTVTERLDDGTPWGRLDTAARLSVLAPQDGALRLVGETPAFGRDERVFGTRFVATRGFVITARQIDPLFTFDLSDPANPRIVGELEMPGFIAYLHPIDDTHLLGVGAQRTEGGTNQVKVTLLDVSDLARPVEVSTVLVGEGWAWSEALWDAKAFTWLPSRKLLAIPFADPGGIAPFVSDLRLFRVDAASGITPAGRLSMADVYLETSGFDWSWSPYVRRSILADEYVYAVSDAGIRSARVSALPAWLATVQFPPVQP